jgi:hypothetical protein
LAVTRPVQQRIVADRVTAHHRVDTSRVPLALTSVMARRILRPRGPLVRKLPFDGQHTPTNVLTRVNAGEVSVAPPKAPLVGAPTLDDLAGALRPAGLPPWVERLLRRYPRLPWLLLVVAVVLALVGLLLLAIRPLPAGALVAVVLLAAAAGLVWAALRLRRWQAELATADGVREDGQTPAAVDDLRRSPDFRVIEAREPFTPTVDGRDSAEAVRYKTALRDAYTLVEAAREAAVPREAPPLDLPALTGAVVTALDPHTTVARHTYGEIVVPQRIRAGIGSGLVEAMAYPEIGTPMYKPLLDKSVDYFLPNIGLIEPNTISLLETNQVFIEAYLVGLNHEFARELLWREYPTDQRGTCFRQFWDATGYLDGSSADPAARRERLKDIPPLDRWPRASRLGEHDHREQGGANEEEVVLVIRGELLKKYPTAVIYAHRARWQRNEDGTIDNTVERRLDDPGAADAPAPPRDKVKTPLYEARADPDITFFGFDLTVAQARGGTGEHESDDPGWFFVIKERPGEPRFGLDIGAGAEIHVWNDLGWDNVMPGGQPGDHLQITAATPTITLTPLPPGESEQAEQAADDLSVRWHRDTDSAELAYLLYQVPALVAVHAAEMLPSS